VTDDPSPIGDRAGQGGGTRSSTTPPHDHAPQIDGTHAGEIGGVKRNELTWRLLAGYGAALDSIAAKPAIVFMSQRAAPRTMVGRPIRIPRANFLAGVLAEMHVAARVDALLRRAQRFHALDPKGDNPLDLGRLQDFRSSLRPAGRKALVVWVILFSLTVAFPVAWITDNLRILAPKAIVCNRGFSMGGFVAGVAGTNPPPAPQICGRLGSGSSLVEVLVRFAHLNVNPGGVIDTVLSVRAGGVVVVLLLAVVLILCVCVVLMVFRSGFRLKRLALSSQLDSPGGQPSLLRSGTRSEGLYRLERDVFGAVGVGDPRELPLDLVVSAGLLVLPLTIASDLLVTATLPRLGIAIPATLAVVGLALILLVAIRLQWLFRVWRSRIGSKLIEPRERWLPDRSTVLVRDGAYGAVLVATGYAVWFITALATPDLSATEVIISLLLFVPIVTWPLCMLWWYRLHRELAASGRSLGLPLARAPKISLIPTLCAAGGVVLLLLFGSGDTSIATSVADWLLVVGFVGVPVSVYRMGRNVARLQRRATGDPDGKARTAGLRSVAMFFPVPVWTILYFQRSLNRVWRVIATPEPISPGVASTVPERPVDETIDLRTRGRDDQPLPVADWYADPECPGQLRYWDGHEWTEHRAPLHTQQAQWSPNE
jgi:hypothetical protein